jgi:hypothetical protein
MAALEVRLLFIVFGVLLLATAPFYYRWGKSPSKDEWEWRRKMQMYPGLVFLIGIGIVLVALGVLGT